MSISFKNGLWICAFAALCLTTAARAQDGPLLGVKQGSPAHKKVDENAKCLFFACPMEERALGSPGGTGKPLETSSLDKEPAPLDPPVLECPPQPPVLEYPPPSEPVEPTGNTGLGWMLALGAVCLALLGALARYGFTAGRIKLANSRAKKLGGEIDQLKGQLAAAGEKSEEDSAKIADLTARREKARLAITGVEEGEGPLFMRGVLAVALYRLDSAHKMLAEDPHYLELSAELQIRAVSNALFDLDGDYAEAGFNEEQALEALSGFCAGPDWRRLRRAELIVGSCAPSKIGWFQLRLGLTIAAAAIRAALESKTNQLAHYGRLFTPIDLEEAMPVHRDEEGAARIRLLREAVSSVSDGPGAVDYHAFRDDTLEGEGDDIKVVDTFRARTLAYKPAEWRRR